MKQKKPPIVHRCETAAKTRIFHVEEMDIEFSNGTHVTYERVNSSANGAVLIVPILKDDTVLLIREYAGGVLRYELALPKGKVENNEDILSAANREIMEEIGYAAHDLQHINSYTIAPGYISHTTHIVLARDLYPQRCQGDEPEEIEVVPWSLSELDKLIQHEECTEARSIAALYQVRDMLNRRTL